jgi:hypothetical protein
MVSTSVLHTAPRFVLFEDPDGQTGMAVYRLGKWRGINRWRGFVLHRRRSKRPYLEVPGSKVRIPVQIMSEVE